VEESRQLSAPPELSPLRLTTTCVIDRPQHLRAHSFASCQDAFRLARALVTPLPDKRIVHINGRIDIITSKPGSHPDARGLVRARRTLDKSPLGPQSSPRTAGGRHSRDKPEHQGRTRALQQCSPRIVLAPDVPGTWRRRPRRGRDASNGVGFGRRLARHAVGDWGDVSAEAAAENDFSVGRPLRILSAYVAENGTRFWVITEADRSATTVLLPEEY
jgi:hypothetical protein